MEKQLPLKVTMYANFALKCLSVNTKRQGFDAFFETIVILPIKSSLGQVGSAHYLLSADAEAPIVPVPKKHRGGAIL